MTDDPARPPAEYVSKTEAARRLGISTRQLDRLVSAGRLSKYRRDVGRTHVQYKTEDLAALLIPAAANDE